MNNQYNLLIEFVKGLADHAKNNVPKSFSAKENNELVSEVDSYIESKLRTFIETNFPNEKIWGEENGGEEGGWLIDPIDGTRHYLFGIPLSSISLVRIQNDESVFAIVANIMTNEIFVAEKGKGAKLISESSVNDLKFNQEVPVNETIVSWDHVMKDSSEAEWAAKCYQRSLETFSRTRMLGSGALSLCYLGRNYFQIFIKSIRKTKEKADIFGGLLIAQEAGATFEIVRYQEMDFYLVGTSNAIDTVKSRVLI